MPVKKAKKTAVRRGPKVKEDKKKPVQVYIMESEVMAIGQYLNPDATTYAECVAEVREHVLNSLLNHAALEA